MDGHGAAVGGAIVDSGNFDWMAHKDMYPGLCTPDESYHGITYAEKFGKELDPNWNRYELRFRQERANKVVQELIARRDEGFRLYTITSECFYT